MALAPQALAAPSVSSNWAGYVAFPSARTGRAFSSISGSWIQPTATCTAAGESASAIWVGLGGYSSHSPGLEQIGTDSDCSPHGTSTYYSWFELLPAATVDIPLAVHPGDAMTASVTVSGSAVTLRLRDATTGQRFSQTRRDAHIDRSTADWIVEAPTVCEGVSRCGLLSLTNFGEVPFTLATAVAGGHTGAVSDTRWSSTQIELQQEPSRQSRARGSAAGSRQVRATVTSAGGSLGGFDVKWVEEAVPAGRRPPAAPPAA